MTSRGVGGFAALTTVTALLLGVPGCGNGSSAGTDGATATPASQAQFGLTPEPGESPTPIRPFGLTPEPEQTPLPSSSPAP